MNDLVRTGLAVPHQRSTFMQRTATPGLRIDVSHVAGALDTLGGSTQR